MVPFVNVPPSSPEHAAATAKQAKRIRTISRPFLPDPLVTVPIYFDPKIVAAKDEGWEEMLEKVLMRWLDIILMEKRTKA